MKRTLLMTVALAFVSHMAAALTADELAATLTAEGYGFIQIKTGETQIKVQAIKDGQKVETIYDAATGTVLTTKTRAVETIVSVDPGVRLREVPRDFVVVNADGTVTPTAAPEGGHGRKRGRAEAADEGAVTTDDAAAIGAPAAAVTEGETGERGGRGEGRGRGRGRG